jgi:RNA polymerase sigma-70 factor (ECF subfamily)
LRQPSEAIHDQVLVLRWRRDADRAALNELLGRWDRRLFYYIRRITDDEPDAWDVLQQTLLQIARKLATLRDPARLPAWLYGIARNAARANQRSRWALDRHVNGESDVALLGDDDAEPDAPVARLDDAELVHLALAQLPATQREVLTLLFLQDLTIDEIAAVVGVPPGTVKSRVYYAKRAMRAILSQHGVSHD